MGNTQMSSYYDISKFAEARRGKPQPLKLVSKTSDNSNGVSLPSGSRAYFNDMFIKETMPAKTRVSEHANISILDNQVSFR